MHVASVHVDLGQVHPSWLVRALQEESPAVQRLVAASVPESLRHPLQAGLLLDSQDLVDRAPGPADVPRMGQWASGPSGWSAAKQSRDDDPPALVAICGLSARAGYPTLPDGGACQDDPLRGKAAASRRTQQSERERDEWFRGRLGAIESEFEARARADVQSIAQTKLPRRLHAARIGLFTVARLLADSEPFRLRWALQHWPYPIVKLTRSLMSDATSRAPVILRGEAQVLKTAWERLTLEGRLDESLARARRRQTRFDQREPRNPHLES